MTQALLFDLDGTLADTAADLGAALNHVRAQRDLPPMPVGTMRPYASLGARGLLQIGLNLTPEDPAFGAAREVFLNYYERHICRETRLFPGIAGLLEELERRGIPWGVVTNKIARFTLPLMRALELESRAACIVSGDTCARAKPHPDPLLEAARLAGATPDACIYLGDDQRDTQAALAAGMRSIVALYGYLNGGTPEAWGAHGMIGQPREVLKFL